MARIFLTAEWRHLAMLNFTVDPRLLEPLVPHGTRLDLWHGQALVSIVGFMFYRTRVLGMPIPLHTEFEELNLRFYIVRDLPTGPRRGVCFIKEVVKLPVISIVANLLYNENYKTLPMRHAIKATPAGTCAQYQWRIQGRWHTISCTGQGAPAVPVKDSEAEFITEHYWGYSTQRDGGAMEYEVTHPPWRLWSPCDFSVDVDFAALYGPAFGAYLNRPPVSALLAEGSAITVSKGLVLKEPRSVQCGVLNAQPGNSLE
jgi:uncharacterized protein YqjF (DUF2071 family)